jgi:hypothetical protein
VDGFSEKGGEGENDSILFTNIDKLCNVKLWNNNNDAKFYNCCILSNYF